MQVEGGIARQSAIQWLIIGVQTCSRVTVTS